HLQTQPGRIQPIDSSHLAGLARAAGRVRKLPCVQQWGGATRRTCHEAACRRADRVVRRGCTKEFHAALPG
ncbi:hypothetical protein, partial [Bordetella pertussis]|uniref:hypothetical protein n=1 Tax=Bordetella pertussis TaxID=520 RepID=UPI001C9E1D04